MSFDAFLQSALRVVRSELVASLPVELFDVWAVRGEFERIAAVLAFAPGDTAQHLAWYASLDPDRERAERHARASLIAAGVDLPIVLGLIPHTEGVLAAARAAFQRERDRESELRMWMRVLEPAAFGAPDPDDIGDPAQLAVLARTLGRAGDDHLGRAGEDHLAMAWTRASELDREAVLFAIRPFGPLVLATRSLDAWHLVPPHRRDVAIRVAAYDERMDVVEQWLAEAGAEADLLRASAAIGCLELPIAATAEPTRTTIIDESERRIRHWAACAMDRATLDRAIIDALVAARDRVTAYLHSLGQRPEPVEVSPRRRQRVLDAIARASDQTAVRGAIRVIEQAGRNHQYELVREAVELFERTHGELRSYEHGRTALVHAWGRSLDLAGGDRPHDAVTVELVGALDRDGHHARALEYADHFFALGRSPVGLEAVAILARVMLDNDTARARLWELFGSALAELLPAASPDEARDWLARPIEMAPPAATPARSQALEAELAIADDDATALIYADYLQSHGDPRGEVIALQVRGRQAEAHQLIARYSHHLLGPLERFARSNVMECERVFEWRRGFIGSARFAFDSDCGDPPGALREALATLFEHPSGALLRSLTVMLNLDDGTCDFSPAVDALAKYDVTALRELRIGEFRHTGPRAPERAPSYPISWARHGDMSRSWPRLARLESLTLQGSFRTPVFEGIDLPSLRRLAIITGGMARENTRAIVEARWPALETLELWFGSPSHGFTGGMEDVLPLLDGTSTPRLHTLRLVNATFTNELIEPLARSALLPRLRELSLALGTLHDGGAKDLDNHAHAFGHLEVLDLEDTYLYWGEALVRGIAKSVWTNYPRDDEHDEQVAVGE